MRIIDVHTSGVAPDMSPETELHTPHAGAPADAIPIQYHAQMLLDENRMQPFAAAIAQVVRPGMHVLDLGAGTGVMSYFAARQGARVTAIEREPGVLATARTALSAAVGETAQVLHADARTFVPDEPVDLVICEMLHVGLLRERQIEVIAGFKDRYAAAFGEVLPGFLPEACLQAVQPVEQDFTFHGYHVPVPLFQEATAEQPRTMALADPQIFQTFFYAGELPATCAASMEFTLANGGTVNAMRLITKNVLASQLNPPSSVDWLMGYLVVPLAEPVTAGPGETVRLTFDYRPGDEITVPMTTARAALVET
jgi:protein arginine N-methyltransferase 1